MLSVLQPPPTAEELVLKEQVTQMLTSQGVLAKLKAELRAAVFEIMHEREGFVTTNDPIAPKLSDFPAETTTTALSLIIECLRFFHWEHALHVLLAESNAEYEQPDSISLAKKLGFTYTNTPTLFQLIESMVDGEEQSAVSPKTFTSTKHNHFDEDDENEDRGEVCRPAVMSIPKAKSWEQEEVVRQVPSKETESTELRTKDEAKDEDGGSSAEIEESMAEEVPSESELDESNFTNGEDEESQDQSAVATTQPTTFYSRRVQDETKDDDKALEDSHEKNKHESEDEDAVSLAAPPPAPTKLPSLSPLVGTSNNSLAGDVEDNFDAEEEAERLRKLDAALQAMEAEDDTGTLQQLKASLQMELQEQDSFVSSSGVGKAGEGDGDDDDREAETSVADKEEEDDDGYGSSDFEEEEEIASDISEEMESMPELSDKEDESDDGAAIEAEPPRVLRNDARVDSEDALNSYDYIEDVEKSD